MEPRLFSIEQAPRGIPAWEQIIEDLGQPPPERIARVLGVSRSTIYRWASDGQGPRVACLALFWLTRWGRSAVHTQATNDAMMAVQLARSLTEERDRLKRLSSSLETENLNLLHDLAITRLRLADRDSAATAADSRTDKGHGDALVACKPAAAAPVWPALDLSSPWPALQVEPMAEADAATTAPSWNDQPPGPQRAATGATLHPGSPEGPRPEAHSARCPDLGHSALPRSSAQLVVSLSLPLASDRSQSDAILTSQAAPRDLPQDLFYMRQAHGAAAGTPAASPQAFPATSAALPPFQKQAAGAGLDGLVAATTASQPARTNSRHDAPGTPSQPSSGARGAAPTAPQIRCAAESVVARAGTPPSAARPERPASVGSEPHTPAPRAPDPPGAHAFAAIVANTTLAAFQVQP
jgi:predicted DNA-binding transcriptional regulator AlpA